MEESSSMRIVGSCSVVVESGFRVIFSSGEETSGEWRGWLGVGLSIGLCVELRVGLRVQSYPRI